MLRSARARSWRAVLRPGSRRSRRFALRTSGAVELGERESMATVDAPFTRLETLRTECEGAAEFLARKLQNNDVMVRVHEALNRATSSGDVKPLARSLIDAIGALFQGADAADLEGVRSDDVIATEGCIQVAHTLVKWGCRMEDDVVVELLKALTQSASRCYADERIRALAVLYNDVPEVKSALRLSLYMGLIQLAGTLGKPNRVRALLASVHQLSRCWNLDALQKRKLLSAAIDALSSNGLADESIEIKERILESLQGSPVNELDEYAELASGTVREVLASSRIFRFDHILDLDVVQNLRIKDKYRSLLQLLEVFVRGGLEDLRSLVSEGRTSLDDLGMDFEFLTWKMRMLTLSSLARESQVVQYRDVERQLDIDESDVEKWVIEAIASGLMEGKMNQIERTISIDRVSHRSFNADQWIPLSEKINIWQANVSELIQIIRVAKKNVQVDPLK
mmetsp:Transcript_5332/g.10978  ORF Transcript_5332/g.10978 Transcript_5332/m.10978 type:complete len:453 (-) Transcript_5332:590-1948(-)